MTVYAYPDYAPSLRQKIAAAESELTALYREQDEVDLAQRYDLFARIHYARERLYLLEYAYHRARQGQHGFCEDCNQLIQPERLEACPETTRCITCARQAAKAQRSFSSQPLPTRTPRTSVPTLPAQSHEVSHARQ